MPLTVRLAPAQRIPTLLAALLLASAACREPTSPGAASEIRAASAVEMDAQVGTTLAAPLVAQALDSRGRGVPGIRIAFTVVQGEATLSATSAVTDRDGRAETRVTVGSVATQIIVSARAGGLSPAEFTIRAAAGPLARITLSPRNVRLAAVGDTARFRVSYEDQFRNQASPVTPTFTAVDPAVFDVDAQGLVTAKQVGVTGRIAVAAGGKVDTAYVIAGNATASACLGYEAARSLAVGAVVTADERTMAVCVGNPGGALEFVAIPVHASGAVAGTVPLEISGAGIGGTAVRVVAPVVADASAQAPALQPDAAFDRMLREQGRTVYAKRWAAARASREDDDVRAPLANLAMASVPTGAVGSTVTLNGSPDASCSTKDNRTARVVAISRTVVILADVENPTGGFTDTEYARFADDFDDIVTPIDTLAFGTPTDVDNNGKVVIFFTRAVNQLSVATSPYYVGGFFHPRDVLTTAQCPASNGGEMMYMLVPDPNGEVRTASGAPARSFSKAFVENITVATLAHEYQHLINAFRRAYVTKSAEDEVDWLNEGLSHIAEELLFFRESGTGPGQNLGGDRLLDTGFRDVFQQYERQNFDRLSTFLARPDTASPWSGVDVAPRGAIWAFLRYAADQRAPGQADVWRRLVNSTTSGLANLRGAFGEDLVALERDWLVSLMTDDYAAGTPARYTQPTWDYRSMFTALRGGYPLLTRSLGTGATQSIGIRTGSAAYYRFTVAAGGEGLVRLTSGGLPPRGTVQLIVVRTK